MKYQLKIFDLWIWFCSVFILMVSFGFNVASANEPPPQILLHPNQLGASQTACFYGNYYRPPFGMSETDYTKSGTNYTANISPVNINVDENGIAELDLTLTGGSKKFAVCKCNSLSAPHQTYFSIPEVSGSNISVEPGGFGDNEDSIRVNDDDGNAIAYIMPYIWIHKMSNGDVSRYVSFSELYNGTVEGNTLGYDCTQIYKLLIAYSVTDTKPYAPYQSDAWLTVNYLSSYGSKFLIKFANNVERAFKTNFSFNLYMGFRSPHGYLTDHPFATFNFNFNINPINQCDTGVYVVDFGALSQNDVDAGTAPKDVNVVVKCRQSVGEDTIQLSFDAERASLSSASKPVVKLTNHSSGNELNIGVLLMGEVDNDLGKQSNLLLTDSDKKINGEAIDANKQEHSFNFTAQLLKLDGQTTELGNFSGYATLMLNYK